MLLEPSRSEYLRLTRAWVSGAFAAGPWAADAADITDQDLLVEALPGYHQMDVCDNYRGAHRPYHRACKAPGPARHNRMFAAGALGVVQRVAGSPCGDGRLRHALARSVGTNGSAALCSPPCGGLAASPVPPPRVACDIRAGEDACLLPRLVGHHPIQNHRLLGVAHGHHSSGFLSFSTRFSSLCAGPPT